MIRKLKVRIVILVALGLTLSSIGLVFAIHYINMQTINNQMRSVLNILMVNDGKRPISWARTETNSQDDPNVAPPNTPEGMEGVPPEIPDATPPAKPEDMDEELYEAFKIMVANNRKLFTRIGLNSGEMIAGYMGSENKKNYTMMGNNVNLAARLEGVNKQYSTGGILISAATRNLLGDRFVVRSLDRVRVVNVNTPIRLYELICEKEGADPSLLKYYEDWENALADFENKNYDKALAEFKKLHEIKPDDNVAAYYIMMNENFFIKGKYPTEHDDVGVAYNEEDGVFKLMQK